MKKQIILLTSVLALAGCSSNRSHSTASMDSSAADQTYSSDTSINEASGTDKKMSKMDHIMMKDGKMMVMKGGKSMMMEEDMTLSDGTKVMKDGTMMMKDGTTKMMKDGDMMMM
ncbi:MAG: DUF6799 domain-containing protein, partial [Limisphaerales bacterium]